MATGFFQAEFEIAIGYTIYPQRMGVTRYMPSRRSSDAPEKPDVYLLRLLFADIFKGNPGGALARKMVNSYLEL